MVAVGLMAILLTMIAFIFYGATQAFRAARASIEIHESARSALNSLVSDLAAAEFTAYDNGVQGYFALSQGPTDPATGGAPPFWNGSATYAVNNRVIATSVVGGQTVGNEYICIAVPAGPPPSANWQLLGPWPISPNSSPANIIPAAIDTLTFTTLAAQPGARDAAPESVEQLALVRYALEWDGGYATLPGGGAPQPTYNLVKRVRFPCTSDPNLNMDQFGWAIMGPTGQPAGPGGQPVTPPNYQYLLPLEYTFHTSPPLASTDPDVVLDAAGLRYAQSEVIAFHVLSMNIRLFCLPMKNSSSENSEVFVEAGTPTAAPPNPSATDGPGSPPGPAIPSLTDTTKIWPVSPFLGIGPGPMGPLTPTLRILSGTAAGESLYVTSANGISTLNLAPVPPPPAPNSPTGWSPAVPDDTSQYRVDGYLSLLCPPPPNPPLANTPPPPPPGWYQRVSPGNYSYNFLGTTCRPPAAVEITLQMTDVRATRAFTFTQRFYITASER
ncbi:MAG: type II secretion system protein J [Candidatus Brocadiia bacterium]